MPRNPSGGHRGFLKIFLGSGMGQVVSILAVPIVARFYSPTEFGTFALVLAIVGMLAPVSTLGLDQAIIRPGSKADLASLILTGFLASSIVSFFAFWVLWMNPGIFRDSDSSPLFLAAALSSQLFLNCCALILNQIAVRNRHYSSLGIRNSVQSSTIALSQITIGALNWFTWANGLIIGSILGSLIGVLVLVRYLIPFVPLFRSAAPLTTIKAHWRYPVIFAPANVFDQLALQAPLYVSGLFFSLSETGQLGMAERLVVGPIALIAFAGASTFDGEVSQKLRSDARTLKSTYLRHSKAYWSLGALFSGSIWFLAPPLLPYILGSSWNSAIPILQLMAFAAGTRLAITPIKGIFRSLAYARVLFMLNVIRIILIALAVVVIAAFDLPFLHALGVLYFTLATSDILLWAFGLNACHRWDSHAAQKHQ